MKVAATKYISAIFLLVSLSLAISANMANTTVFGNNLSGTYNDEFSEEVNYIIIEPQIQTANADDCINDDKAEDCNSNPSDVNPDNTQSSGIKIELVFGKQRFVYTDKYIHANNHLVAEELYAHSINGTFSQKRAIMTKCLTAGGSYKNAVLYTMPLLAGVVETAIDAVNCDPTDSTIQFNPDTKPMFRITRERPGRKANEEKLYMRIYSALIKAPQIRLAIQPDSITPTVTAEDNVQLTTLRTRYSTSYARSNENRKHNINLALKKVNGTVLPEGGEFSFNKTVGRRGEANGFKESPIIVGGKYENGTGGGVCQVSTTLYNAALLSDLKILSVRNHSLECHYELPSFDAMVNIGSQDLRFKNTGKTSVFIRTYGTDTHAVAEVYGSKLPYEIKRHSEVIYRKDPPGSLTVVDTEYKYFVPGDESGQKKVVSYSHGEMKSVGYLLYYDKQGFLIKKTKIREDIYHSVAGLIAISP